MYDLKETIARVEDDSEQLVSALKVYQNCVDNGFHNTAAAMKRQIRLTATNTVTAAVSVCREINGGCKLELDDLTELIQKAEAG